VAPLYQAMARPVRQMAGVSSATMAQ